MAEEKKGFFSRLVAGLTKTRNAVVNGLDDIFNGPGDVESAPPTRSWRTCGPRSKSSTSSSVPSAAES